MYLRCLQKLSPSPGGRDLAAAPTASPGLTSEKGKPRVLWQLYQCSGVELFIQFKDILIHKRAGKREHKPFFMAFFYCSSLDSHGVCGKQLMLIQ